ncbi:MAG: WXG100 family type VII secretion target [Corynebacterium matruchotii]|jgi:WXG100 family type VII secretion target|uniref:WXG100 family type VII secretion target n=1 Tax=Corynebacterium matruchotii TaxID=43768 RepID=UPI000F6D8080|nr:WXG100 family type VII secretion target [Corynebacterium matruchotii]VEI99102.1 ESAT-6-like protein [Corynebacterium matruchotii]
MSIFSYNNSDAENASGDIKNVISEIEGTLTDMDGDMNKLGAAWEGSEQEEYQQIHGKWSSSAQNMRGILEQIRGALDENSSNVSEMRGRASNAISGQ